MVELRLEGLTKRFGARTVFRKLSTEVRSGEVLVVAGNNGAGKSTLLGVVAGLLRPDAGVVRLLKDGREVAAEDRRHHVALVAPELHLYHELTAYENLELFAELRGLVCNRRLAGEMLARMGLKGREDDRLATFSSGMRVRVKYAVALFGAPSVLLLDEPTAMLDETGVSMVEQIIAEQRSRGVLILATNDAREKRFADLLLQLD